MKVHVADIAVLSRLLNRKKRHKDVGYEVDLGVVLKEILTWANRLVPSESGSILLDDPLLKLKKKSEGRLYFAACFGRGSASLVGTSMSEKWGIAGETYRKGRPYISKDVRKDTKFYPKIDEKTRHETKSIICAPIDIDESIIGVIELINRKDRINYDRNDLALLEIFAGYNATLIENALIARSFEELSKRDNLTGLYNDRYFFHWLEREVERVTKKGGDVVLIFFDLDRFKEVNDTHGHLAGSMVLKEVADILREIFRATEAVSARYGGDEYVIILSDTGLRDAMKYAERIRDRIASNIFLKRRAAGSGTPFNIRGVLTCSVGVSSLSQNIRQEGNIRQLVEALIKSADSAMYSAKKLGKNRVCIAGGKKVLRRMKI